MWVLVGFNGNDGKQGIFFICFVLYERFALNVQKSK